MDEEQIIKAGPLKGKRITFSPTIGIEKYRSTADEFMEKIFALEPGDYLISDDSAISDFKGVNNLETIEAIRQKIQEIYGITPESNNLVTIFERIANILH